MAKAIIQIGDIGTDWWTGQNTKDVVFSQIDNALKNKATEIEFAISSFGGDVYLAFAIYDKIKELEVPTRAKINGYCMSAGTVIACACNQVIAGDASTYMIHDSWWWAEGNKEAMQIAKAELEHIDKKLAQIYHQKTGVPLETLHALMSANREQGSKFTAQEALDMGFVDIIDNSTYKEKVKGAIKASFHNPNSNPKSKTNMAKSAMEKLNAAVAKVLGIKAAAETQLQDGEGTVFILGDTDFASAEVGTPIGYYSEEMGFSNASEGDHTLADGATITVDSDGKLVSYTPSAPEAKEDKEPEAMDKDKEPEAKEDLDEKIAQAVEKAMAKAIAPIIASSEAKIEGMASTMEKVVTAMGGANVAMGKIPKAQSAERSPSAKLTKEQMEIQRLKEAREGKI